jgi:cell division protein ZapA (FtsZ GTPase activity inhibitor)
MSEAASTSVAVNIYDKIYTFALAPGQTEEQIQQIARYVDDNMRQVGQLYRPPSPLQTAVLAALNMVDELFKLQTEYRATESDIAQRASRLTASLGRLFEQVQLPPVSAEKH